MIKKIQDQIQFDEEYIPHKKSHSLKLKKKKSQNLLDNQCNSNKWTLLENQRFLDFIKANQQLLLCLYRRKEEKVFLQLSKQVKTRSADQCRSHHQKMIKHHNDLEGIINHLEKRLGSINQEEQVKSENSQIQHITIKQSEKIIKSCSDTYFEIEVEEPKQQLKQDDSIWGFLDEEVWINNSLLFSNINY